MTVPADDPPPAVVWYAPAASPPGLMIELTPAVPLMVPVRAPDGYDPEIGWTTTWPDSAW